MDGLELFVHFVFLLCSVGLGYIGGRFYALTQHRLSLGLELRIQDIENRLVKESRRVAGNLSARARSVDDELLEMARETLAKSKKTEPDPAKAFYFPEA